MRRPRSLLLLVPTLLFALALALGQRARLAAAQTPATPRAEEPRHRGRSDTAPPPEVRAAAETDVSSETDASAAGDAAATEPEHEDAPPPPPGPRRVYVGLYLHRVPQLDLGNNSYLADFWLWFRWQGEDLDPSSTFEFLNLYESWDVSREPVYRNEQGEAQAESLPGGWRYQVFHMHARFGHAFDVRAYPFDRQQLEFAVEDSDLDTARMIYVPDTEHTAIDPGLVIPGWSVGRLTASVVTNSYPTNFGDTRRTTGADHYSRVRFVLGVGRPVFGYALTTLLPIGIVMLITFVMFLIDPRYFEGRLGLGITSLLSAVALQLTASGNLPKTGYLVLLDHIYNLSYATILLAILQSVFSVRMHDKEQSARAKRFDLFSLAGLLLFYFGTSGLLIALR